MSNKWWISQFPESLYPTSNPEYSRRVIEGRQIAEKSRVVICGLARDCAKALVYNIARVEKLGSLFKDYLVVIRENDSVDQTPQLIVDWYIQNTRLDFRCSPFNSPKLSDFSFARRELMAKYRNDYLERIKTRYSDYDFVIVYDFDVLGGFSYHGIFHSLSHLNGNIGGIGSNSILYREYKEKLERLYYDTWALRLLEGRSHNLLRWDRGEEPFKVKSVGGGLLVYKMEALKDVKYTADDCDHVTLHEQMKFDILLNPNQITLYNEPFYKT